MSIHREKNPRENPRDDLSIYPEEVRRRIEAHERTRQDVIARLEKIAITRPEVSKRRSWLARKLLGL